MYTYIHTNVYACGCSLSVTPHIWPHSPDNGHSPFNQGSFHKMDTQHFGRGGGNAV